MPEPHSDALILFAATGDLAYKQILPVLHGAPDPESLVSSPSAFTVGWRRMPAAGSSQASSSDRANPTVRIF